MMSGASPQTLAEIASLLERRRIAQAKAKLKNALEADPDHLDLLLLSVWADSIDGRAQAAMATVRQVLARDPKNETALQFLFEFQLDQNLLGQAEETILTLLRDAPECASFYGQYAEVMIRAMMLPKARALAEEGLKYDPANIGCLVSRAICDLIEQGHGKVSHALQQLLASHPQSLRTLTLVRAALYHRGRYGDSLRIAQELVRAQPDDQALASVAGELSVLAHWSMLPLRPLRRWGLAGWGALMLLWVAVLIGLAALALPPEIDAAVAKILGGVFVIYVLYALLWPPFLRRGILHA